ncbi:phage tail length tape measure family protein [Bradyrhizobium sp. USDA 4454]
MSGEVASLGLSVDSSQVKAGTQDLKAFSGAANDAGKAADNLSSKAKASVSVFGDMSKGISAANAAAKDTSGTVAQMGASINAALSKNVISFDAMRKGIADANGVIQSSVGATEKLAAAHGGLSTQGQAAFHSIRSFGEQLLLGIPPTQALTGQLNHLSFAATGQGGVSGALKEVAGWIGGILTPMRLAVGGAAGLAAGALYLGNSWSESSNQIDRSLIGIGERTGSTAADINSFAKANSSAMGMSIADSRSLGIELTKTGNVAVGSLKGAGDAVRGYALLTGKDATEATKDFASALSGDLVEGIKKLDAPYGSLNAATLDYIRSLDLQAAGSLDASAKTQALQVWIDGVAASNRKAEDTVGGLTKAYQFLSNTFSLIKNGPGPGNGPIASPEQLRQQQSTAVNALGPSADLTNLGGPEGLAGVAQMGAQLDELNKKLHDIDAGPARAQLNALSKASDDVVHKLDPQIDKIEDLKKALATLETAKASGVAAPGADAAITAIQNIISKTQEAQGQAELYNQRVAAIGTQWGAVGQSTAMALQAAQNQLPVYEAIGGAAKMAAQATADYNNYLDQGKTTAEALALSASNYAAAQAQVNSSAQEQLAALRDQFAVASARTPLQQAAAQAEATYNQLVREGVDGLTAENVALQQRANAQAQISTAQAVADQQEENARYRIWLLNQKPVEASQDQLALFMAAKPEESREVGRSKAIQHRTERKPAGVGSHLAQAA